MTGNIYFKNVYQRINNYSAFLRQQQFLKRKKHFYNNEGAWNKFIFVINGVIVYKPKKRFLMKEDEKLL